MKPLPEMYASSFDDFTSTIPVVEEIERLPLEAESLGGIDINGPSEVQDEDVITHMLKLSMEPLPEMYASSFNEFVLVAEETEILRLEDEYLGGVEVNGSHEVQEEEIAHLLELAMAPLPEMYASSLLDDESNDT